ncbi:hypothetical protein A9K55_005359 [Cordyceps militaris]|uniref:HNH nuclease domain-containing protein n=1 Tax=Cordyceps militaris TaxID=73501 RepID=A0A2H4SPF6_CORMI|nr:hypothetical protein A9K55_005359 [Cordyceps militaris]
MRLHDVCLSRSLPPHLRSSISIWHPGYIRGEDTMLSLPCLDEIGPLDETDVEAEANDESKKTSPEQVSYGVHFETMLLACQVVAGNLFDKAYLSYDRKGTQRVQLTSGGILTHDHYFLHVPQNTDDTDTTSYAVTPNFQEWRFPGLPKSWQSIAVTPRDSKPSCIISGRLRSEKAHIIPQSHDKWYTDNAMRDYSQGAKSVFNSQDNLCQLRGDLHRIFDDRAFALVPKVDAKGRLHTVVHFFSTTNDYGDAALRYHNRKVHSLDSVAPEFLFARFALTIFAHVKDFILGGENRRIAVVYRGIDSNGGPAWLTREVELNRTQRHSRYGGGGSRSSSPTKRSKAQSESRQGDDGESVTALPSWEDERACMSRTMAWVEANQADYYSERPSKRRRIRRNDHRLSLTRSASSQTSIDEPGTVDEAVESDPTAHTLSKDTKYHHSEYDSKGLQMAMNKL